MIMNATQIHYAKVITIILCLSASAILAAWDFWCMKNADAGDTISELSRQANYASGGLLALVSLLAFLGTWVHIFLFEFLPTSWTGIE